MDCTFYSFDKRKNSTKKPSDVGSSRTVRLKDATNITSPTLECIGNDLTAFNYASLFDRYYYIREWRSLAQGLWECELVEDVLASWIDEVKGQAVYAVMSSAHYDPYIDDTRIVPIHSFVPQVVQQGIQVIAAQPSYFVNVIDASSPTGNTLFFGTAVSDFFEEALNAQWYEDLFDKVRGFNPLDMVNEVYLCGLLPSACHEVDGGHTADFGTLFDTVTISGSRVLFSNAKPISYSMTLTPPSPTHTDFRASSKYCKYYLHLPYAGVVTIPTELLLPTPATKVAVTIQYAGDCVSGGLVYSVRVGTTPLGEYGASLKTPIALTRQTGHVAELIAGGLEIAGGVALALGTGGAGTLAAGGGITKGINDVTTGVCAPPDISKVGALGGCLAPMALSFNNNVWLELVEYSSNNEPSNLSATAGRPTHRVVNISQGYYACANASVSFAGLEREIDDFNSALNSGVYVED